MALGLGRDPPAGHGPVGSEGAAASGEDTLVRVSVSSSGAERKDFDSGSTTRCSSDTSDNHYCTKRTVSYDGGLVVFSSKAPNLVTGDTNGVADVFLWREQPPAGQPNVIALTHGGNGASNFASISPKGNGSP